MYWEGVQRNEVYTPFKFSAICTYLVMGQAVHLSKSLGRKVTTLREGEEEEGFPARFMKALLFLLDGTGRRRRRRGRFLHKGEDEEGKKVKGKKQFSAKNSPFASFAQ